MKGVETEADSVTAFADGDYTTNMGLEDVTDGAGVDRRRVGRCAVLPPSPAGLGASLWQVGECEH
jgi:hypothetical protein